MNLLDLLSELDVSFKQAGEHSNIRSGWIGTDCPWCGSVGKFHLGFNIDSYWTSCWQCGSHSLASALIQITGRRPAAVYKLVEQLDRWLTRDQIQEKSTGTYQPPKAGPLQEPHKRYLRSRQFDPDRLERIWSLQGTGPVGELSWSLLAPIEHRGEPVSWVTRSIHPTGRYRAAGPNRERIHHKHLLYGEDLAHNAVIVCEGPADCWKIGPGAVATFGVRVTQQQTIRISKFPVRAICFDNESAAQARARRLAAELDPYPGVTYVIELDAPDPGSCSESEVRQIRRTILGENR